MAPEMYAELRAAALSACVGTLSIFAMVACGSSDSARYSYAPQFTLEDAAEFKSFDLYWVGEEFDGLPMIVTISYGGCTIPAGQITCRIPLSFNQRGYCGLTPEDLGASALDEIRGAPVHWHGGQATLWTGRSSVTINGESRDQTTSVIQNLVGLSGGPATPENDLGPPIDTECR